MAAEDDGSTVDQVTDRIPRDRPLGVVHSGGRYLFGFGPDSYGIWDAATEGPPVEDFPATKQGRIEGWHRYVAIEPAAQQIPAEQSPVQEEIEEVEAPSRRRALLIWGGIGLVLVVAIVVLIATRSSKTATTSTSGGSVTAGGKTHVDISGAVTLSEDLAQKTFTPPARVLTGLVKAGWAGAKTKLTLSFENLSPGQYTTSQVPFRQVDISFTAADGANVEVKSVAGECNIKIDKSSPTSMSGSFDCTGVKPSGSEQTIDIKGTFFANS